MCLRTLLPFPLCHLQIFWLRSSSLRLVVWYLIVFWAHCALMSLLCLILTLPSVALCWRIRSALIAYSALCIPFRVRPREGTVLSHSYIPSWLLRVRHRSSLRALAPCVMGGVWYLLGLVWALLFLLPVLPSVLPCLLLLLFFAYGFGSSWVSFFLFFLLSSLPSLAPLAPSFLVASSSAASLASSLPSPVPPGVSCGYSRLSSGSSSGFTSPCFFPASFCCSLLVPCLFSIVACSWHFASSPFLCCCCCCVFSSHSCTFLFLFTFCLGFLCGHDRLLVHADGTFMFGSFYFFFVGSYQFSGSSCVLTGSFCSWSSIFFSSSLCSWPSFCSGCSYFLWRLCGSWRLHFGLCASLCLAWLRFGFCWCL